MWMNESTSLVRNRSVRCEWLSWESFGRSKKHQWWLNESLSIAQYRSISDGSMRACRSFKPKQQRSVRTLSHSKLNNRLKRNLYGVNVTDLIDFMLDDWDVLTYSNLVLSLCTIVDVFWIWNSIYIMNIRRSVTSREPKDSVLHFNYTSRTLLDTMH